jgi:hypothetical protein
MEVEVDSRELGWAEMGFAWERRGEELGQKRPSLV